MLGGFTIGFALTIFGNNEPVMPLAPSPESPPARAEIETVSVSPPIADAPSRMTQLLETPASLARDVELADLLDRMSKEDFAACAEGLQDWIKKRRHEDQLIGAILDAWFESDALSARHAAKQVVADTKNSYHDSPAGYFGAAAARHDPKWAVDHLLSDPGSDTPGWTSNAVIMEEVIKKDRKLADAAMEQYRETTYRQSLLAGYVSGLADLDPLAAMDVAVSEKTFERVNLISTALRAAARTGENTARLALSKIDDPPRRRLAVWNVAAVLGEESVTNPFTFLRDEGGLEMSAEEIKRGMPFEAVPYQFVKRDPVEAANWAMSLPDEQKELLLGSVLSRWSHSDPEGMLNWIREQDRLAASGKQENSTGSTARSLASSLGGLLTAQALLTQGQTEAALQALPKHGNKMLEGKLQEFIWEAAANAPEAAANWVVQLPAGKTRDSLAASVGERFAIAQPAEAAQWIEQIKDQSTRDSAIYGLIRGYVAADPAAASEWVSQISDQKMRDQSLSQVWWQWRSKDAPAAREWVKNLTIIKERVRERMLAQ